MERSNPIENLLTVKQVDILKVLFQEDELTCGEIMDLAHISRSGFYSAMGTLVSAGLVKTISVGRSKTYQINKIGLLLSRIAQLIAKPGELSTSDLGDISKKLEIILGTIEKVNLIIKQIEEINGKPSSSVIDKIKLHKLRKDRDRILEEIDINGRLSNGKGYYGET